MNRAWHLHRADQRRAISRLVGITMHHAGQTMHPRDAKLLAGYRLAASSKITFSG